MSKFVFLAHSPMTGSELRVGSHHLCHYLTDQGHDVLHVVPARSRLRVRTSLAVARVTEFGFRETRIEPTVPVAEALKFVPPIGWGGRRLEARLWRSASKQIRQALATADVVVVDKVEFYRFATTYGAVVPVYRPTDIVSHPRWTTTALREIDAADHADLVIATSDQILANLRARGATMTNTLTIRNGAAIEDLSRHRAEAPSRTAVYVGAIDDRFDWPTLIQVAERLPSWTIDIFGPVARLPGLPHNLRARGSLPHSQLGPVLARYRVGLMPFRLANESNTARSPMKYYEYRAVGLPIVASRQSELESRKDPALFLYSNASEMAGMLEDADQLYLHTFNDEVSDELLQMDWKSIGAIYESALLGRTPKL